MKEKSYEKIFFVLISIIISISSILIGNINCDNTQIINLGTSIMFLFYIIIYGIKRKEKIIKSKFDIYVIIFCLAPIIPIIFKKYLSLNDAMVYVTKYITCLFFYFMTKKIVETEKNRKTLICIIICLTVIQTIIGIDKMTTQKLVDFTDYIGISRTQYEEIRLNSVYDYPNAYGIIAAVSIFLLFGRILKTDNKYKKMMDVVLLYILEIGILLANSRIVMILLVCFFILNLIFLKRKEKILEIIVITIYTGIIALLYSTKFMEWLTQKNFIIIWLSLIISCVFISGIQNVFGFIIKKMVKIKFEILISIVVIFLLFGILAFFVAMKKTDTLKLFNSYFFSKEIVREIYNVNPDYEYNFKFDIIAKNSYENLEIYEIEIIEKNKYFDEIHSTKINFSQYEGIKEISIKTQEETAQIFISFKAEYCTDKTLLEIRKCTINEQEIILEYKYLPYSLVSKISNINFKTKSAWERMAFIGDGIKLLKENWLLGVGGNNWKYHYGKVQQYNYQTTNVHSYPIQIFLEFGIIAFGAFCLIIFYSIKYVVKEKDAQLNEILLAFMLLLIHATFDMDFLFTYITIVFFVFIAIFGNLIKDSQNNKNYNIVKNIFIVVMIIGMIIITTNETVAQILIRKNEKILKSNIDNKNEIVLHNAQICKNIMPYNSKNRRMLIENMLILKNKLNKEIIENTNYLMKNEKGYFIEKDILKVIDIYIQEYKERKNHEDFKLIDQTIKNNIIVQPYYVNYLINRDDRIYYIAEKINRQAIKDNDERLLEISRNIASLIIKEYNQKITNLSNYSICRYNKNQKQRIIQMVDEIYRKAELIVTNSKENQK